MTRSRFERPLTNPIADVQYFAANPMFRQKLVTSSDPADRALYHSLREDWKALGDGIPTENRRERLQSVRKGWDADAHKTYSSEELLARALFPADKVRELLGNGKALLELKRTDALGYAQMQLSATSHDIAVGVTGEQALNSVRKLASQPEVKVEQSFTVTREMTERLGLDPSKRLNLDSFNAAICALVKLEQADRDKAISDKAKQVIVDENAAAAAIPGVE